MRIRSLRYNRIIFAAFVLAIISLVNIRAEAQEVENIYDLALDENLYQPQLGKVSEEIAEFQLSTARALKRDGNMVELMRSGEVIVVTIGAGQLFDACSTELSELGAIVLKPFTKYLKTPGLYKMILVMHSDNTGSAEYTLELTQSRVNAVYDWFDANAVADYVVPYALGSIEPLYPNNSVENRKANRRLEIYLVPGYTMIKQAQSGKISL